MSNRKRNVVPQRRLPRLSAAMCSILPSMRVGVGAVAQHLSLTRLSHAPAASASLPLPPAWALEPSWASALQPELDLTYFKRLKAFVEQERSVHTVLPPEEHTFAAFDACKFDAVSIVILGQDPYPRPGHAHGLSFSVRPDVRPLPGSLRNIFTELNRDLGIPLSTHGYLQSWAEQGVLLLNSALSVRAGEPMSHAGQGWERMTDAAITALAARRTGLVFFLWGAHAQRKAGLIDQSLHLVLRAPHPSPISAHRGFHGCAHFSQANRYLAATGRTPIDWSSHLSAGASAALRTRMPSTRALGTVAAAAPTPVSPSSGAAAAATAAERDEPPKRRHAVVEPAGVAPSTASGTAPGTAPSPMPSTAPFQWWKQWQAIERARSGRNAPVDFIGGHLLGEREDGPAPFRVQTLVGLVIAARTPDAATAHALQRLRVLAAPLDAEGSARGRPRFTATALAQLDELTIRQAISGVAFPAQKAARVRSIARTLVDEYEGDVPRTLPELLVLPGVGPKVAHLVLQIGWGSTEGIAVDSHVHRIAARLGWTRGAKTAEATRKELEGWMPREHWQELHPLFVGFGQQVCADRPACHSCPLMAARVCPQIGNLDV